MQVHHKYKLYVIQTHVALLNENHSFKNSQETFSLGSFRSKIARDGEGKVARFHTCK